MSFVGKRVTAEQEGRLDQLVNQLNEAAKKLKESNNLLEHGGKTK